MPQTCQHHRTISVAIFLSWVFEAPTATGSMKDAPAWFRPRGAKRSEFQKDGVDEERATKWAKKAEEQATSQGSDEGEEDRGVLEQPAHDGEPSDTTVLLPIGSRLAQAMVAAGKRCQEAAAVAQLKGNNKKGDTGDLGKLGSPHLWAWAAMIQEIASDEGQDEDVRGPVLEYWNEVMVKKPVGELLQDVKIGRARAPGKKEQKEGKGLQAQVRVQLLVEKGMEDLHRALLKAMLAEGGVQKVGRPPQGYLTKAAAKQLDKFMM